MVKLLNIPATGVSLTLMVGLAYGRELLIVVIEESSQLFTTYLANAPLRCVKVGVHNQENTKRCG